MNKLKKKRTTEEKKEEYRMERRTYQKRENLETCSIPPG